MPILKRKPLLETDSMYAVGIQISAKFENTEGGTKVADMSAVVTLMGHQSSTGLVEKAEVETLIVDSVGSLAVDPNSNMAKAYYYIVKAIDDEYARQNPEVEDEEAP
jgi:hypothetical protein